MKRESRAVPDTSAADVLKAAEAVAKGARRRVIHASGKPLAIVPHQPRSRARRSPVSSAQAPPARRGKRFSLRDPLWEIRGIVDGPGPTDVAANKDQYLAEAYAAKHG